MMRKIIYLINPISGTARKFSLAAMIADEHKRRETAFEIIATNAAGDYHFLVQKINREEITDVVVCGGDGSVNAVAYALLHTPVNVGIIPMGSGNGLAYTAKIPRKPQQALQLIFTGTPSCIDGFFINNRFSCMLCGIGFDAQVAYDFSLQKKRGLLTYIKATVSHFFKAAPYPFEVQIGDSKFSIEAFFISVANSNQFGNNFTIAPRANLGDGLLDIVIVKKMSKWLLPFSIFRQVTGSNPLHGGTGVPESKYVIYFQTASLSIDNPRHAPLHIDGDPAVTAPSFNIRIVPDAIRLIQP